MTDVPVVPDETKVVEGEDEPYIVLNRSRVEKFLKALLGPQARTWQRNGKIQLGVELNNGNRWLIGEGETWEEALQDAAREAQSAAAEAKAEALRVAKMNESAEVAAQEKPPRVGDVDEGTEGTKADLSIQRDTTE
jgi:hypothetical protein